MRLMTISDIGDQLVLHRRFFFGLLIGIVLLSVLFTWFSPAIYQASVSFYFPANRSVFGISTSPAQDVVRPIIPVLGTDIIKSMFKIIKEPVFRKSLLTKLEEAGESKKIDFDVSQDPSGVYTIYVYDRNPERAVKLAEIYFQTINEVFREISLTATRKSMVFIKSELLKHNELFLDAQQKLNSFLKEHGIAKPAEEIVILIGQKYQIEQDLAKIEIKVEEHKARVNAIQRELAEAEVNISEAQIAADPVVVQLRLDLLTAEIQLQSFAEHYTGEHPKVIELNNRIVEIHKKLASELDRVIGVRTDGLNPIHEKLAGNLIETMVNLEAGEAAKEAANIRLQELEGHIEHHPELNAELTSLEREKLKYARIVRSLEAHLEEVELQVLREFETFQLVSPPDLPTKPKFPVLSINILVSLILGIIVSFLIAIYQAGRTRRHPLYLPEDVLYIPSERAR